MGFLVIYMELLFALNLVTLLMQIQSSYGNFMKAIKLLFALNLVTLLMQIQSILRSLRLFKVVICFKFSNFAYANTVFQRRQS